jgi:hypothetical protein
VRRRSILGGVSAVLVAGCVAAGPTDPASGLPAPASPPFALAVPSPTRSASGGIVASASADGLTLELRAASRSIPSGETLELVARVHSDRADPVEYGVQYPCAPVEVTAALPMPLGPTGRSWEGLAGRFKTFALTEGYGIGSGGVGGPVTTYAEVTPCDGFKGERILAPGETIESRMAWRASVVKGIGVAPGRVVLHATFAHDRLNEAPSPPPPGQIASSWVPMYESLPVELAVEVSGTAPQVLTTGQAIDALLADPRFERWLAEEPPTTWSVANVLLLAGGGGGIVPDVPSWEIDLFREVGVPRTYAIGFVDARSGTVLELSICDDPCDR